MTRLLACALLGCLCLLTRPANSQVAPLRPLVVRLDSGTTTKRALIGIDTAAYRAIRVNTALDQRQLAARAQRIAQLRALMRHDSVATMRQADELRSTRADNASLHAALLKQETLTSNALALPLRPPLLLDAHTYLGGGLGAAVLVLLKVLVFH
jgi:hypothetical protein